MPQIYLTRLIQRYLRPLRHNLFSMRDDRFPITRRLEFCTGEEKSGGERRKESTKMVTGGGVQEGLM